MKIEKVFDHIRYRLSNDDLKNGDKVFPIASGRCIDNFNWILYEINFNVGFPYNPHTILNINHSDYKPYQIKTDKGYSPIEVYYKIIKKEKQVEKNGIFFKSYEWVEF